MDELGMTPNKGRLPVDIAPNLYQREWERAYRYGLAEDALQNILTRMGAPQDPDIPLVQVLSDEENLIMNLLWAIEAMCDTHEGAAWGLTENVPHRRPLWLFLPFIASVVCLGLAVVTSEPRWCIGWPLGCIVGVVTIEFCKRRVKALPPWRFSPKVTFRDLAENIWETARNRAEEMREAAERFRRGGDGTIPA
ncbi:hypothetical protein [Armatimonas rosea]|uniref:Uncharacterized protein n=1 Tax=Armatimonas rosea TaxID=685828 RepID=A0A7W9SML7_ARMRO|nr:hypothetical protein [Armatimonas rosea]MBB6048614.1 hypothetical protein [Armatimonas rosea]